MFGIWYLQENDIIFKQSEVEKVLLIKKNV